MTRPLFESLPTSSTLYNRRIITSSICPKCKLSPETSLHALFWCGPAQQVWSKLGYSWPTNVTWKELWNWFGIYSVQDCKCTCNRFLIAVWAIWHARNKFVMKGKNQSAWDVCAKVESVSKELQQMEIDLPCRGDSLTPSWSLPKALNVKVNFDAAYSQTSHQCCSGFVIRDDYGHVMDCGVQRNLFVSDAFAVEALACIQAMRFTRDMGFHHIEMEGDSRTLILKANRRVIDRSEIITYIYEIFSIALSFINISFKYAERATNSLAHFLAKMGFSSEDERY